MSLFSRRLLRIKAMQALYAWEVQQAAGATDQGTEAAPLLPGDETLQEQVTQLRRAHSSLLQLLCSWASLDSTYQTRASQAKRSWAANRWIQALQQDATWASLRPHYPSLWDAEAQQHTYARCFLPHPSCQAYRVAANPSLQDDTAFVRMVVRKILCKDAALQDTLAAEQLHWAEDCVVLQQLMERFVATFPQDNKACWVPYYQALDTADQTFYTTLLHKTLAHQATYEALLTRQVAHWERARLVRLDSLLLKLALTELHHMPELPRSVSINEYVELAKAYSTPKSYQFIHGLLDSLPAA